MALWTKAVPENFCSGSHSSLHVLQSPWEIWRYREKQWLLPWLLLWIIQSGMFHGVTGAGLKAASAWQYRVRKKRHVVCADVLGAWELYPPALKVLRMWDVDPWMQKSSQFSLTSVAMPVCTNPRNAWGRRKDAEGRWEWVSWWYSCAQIWESILLPSPPSCPLLTWLSNLQLIAWKGQLVQTSYSKGWS